MFNDLTRDDVFRIETRRLWLRWPRASDAAAIEVYASHFDVAKMTTHIPHPYPAGEAARFIARVRAANAAGADLHLAITEKHGARSVTGLISMKTSGLDNPCIGFALAPGHWGKGYATEAARAIIDVAFQLTEAQAIASCVFIGNPASARVHAKCGFISIGPCQQDAPARGGTVEVERFSLTRCRWLGARRGLQHAETLSGAAQEALC